MTSLAAARLASLDCLLRALDLDITGADRFRAEDAPGPFPQAFGGTLVAQALAAATATVGDPAPSSLHACFAAGGTATDPVDLRVDRVRDGRSMATRHVQLEQDGRALLSMIASFATGPTEPAVGEPVDFASRPLDLPELQDWVPESPEASRQHASSWIDRPPAVEIRIAEPPVFLGGRQATGPRSHWFRLPRSVGDDPALHAALLAYASDFLLLDMAFRSHPVAFASGRVMGTSLDHSIWFHRPVRFDQWHHYTQETVALAGARGLVRGSIHDEEGRLAASTAQEVLVRVAEPPEQR